MNNFDKALELLKKIAEIPSGARLEGQLCTEIVKLIAELEEVNERRNQQHG